MDYLFIYGLGFFVGILLFASMIGEYEKPTKWEHGGVIKHQEKCFILQEINLETLKSVNTQNK